MSDDRLKTRDNAVFAAIATSRRGFLTRASALVAGLALADSAPADTLCPAAGGPPAAGGALVEVKEIHSGANKVLSAIVRVDDEAKGVWLASANNSDASGFAVPFCSEKQQMRYFAGATPDGKQFWPTTPGAPAPGPTLRARVGDQVQITFLNHVNVKDFPKTLDQAEQGISKGCDVSTTLVPDANGVMKQVELYPGADKEPDCFHGSSSANLHFHGFHVSPGTIADNVLVQVRPSPRDAAGKPIVTEASVRAPFKQVFDSAAQGHGPKTWGELPATYTTPQKTLLQQYDKTLPPGVGKLWPANEKSIAQGQWPQFYIGAYPFSFKITEPDKPTGPGMPPALMGQAPGTHWYHAHKHGSTALNSFNGMSGVFVVEGDFDDQLRAYYGGRLAEKVLVMQQYGSTLNLLNAVGTPPKGSTFSSTKEPLVFINGIRQPVVTMQPGETQRWRILNACAQVQVRLTGIIGPGQPAAMTWRQIAQDGVQLAYENYNNPAPAPAIAPGNRVDLLVQAPTTPGVYTLQAGFFPFPGGTSVTTLMTINVTGTAVTAKAFPDQTQYPKMPSFLADIDPAGIHTRRDITFATTPGIGRGSGGGPIHTINGKQFSNDDIDQIMALNSVEEWTLYNTAGTVQHPFHIHVNPFQIVEVRDPNKSLTPVQLPKPYVWWDTIAIPAADKNGNAGYVKMRSRFADFVGLFVIHCHILAHEDRGMMQLIEVVTNKTIQEHYH
jgi:FtsP/CotA-like multicopper oxidase with cupredoxin domain